MPRPKGRVLRLKLADLDRSLLPQDARTAGTSAFQNAVSQLLRKQFRLLGGVIETIAITADEVTVTWQPGTAGIDPIIKLLEQGQYKETALLLELLLSDQPNDPILLYNLGMASAISASSTVPCCCYDGS